MSFDIVITKLTYLKGKEISACIWTVDRAVGKVTIKDVPDSRKDKV